MLKESIPQTKYIPMYATRTSFVFTFFNVIPIVFPPAGPLGRNLREEVRMYLCYCVTAVRVVVSGA